MIGRCLESLYEAADHPDLAGIDIRPVVVLDRCSDRTGERATGSRQPWAHRLLVVETSAGSVGAARSVGLSLALSWAADAPEERVWLATTDADTVVPHDWLARQLAWRRAGAEAVAGRVRVGDWSGRPPSTRRAFLRYLLHEGAGLGHPHVHGANLAFGARAYRRAGGMTPVSTGEDRALWDALMSSGAVAVAAGDVVVDTSARSEARAPNGFSSFLSQLGEDA